MMMDAVQWLTQNIFCAPTENLRRGFVHECGAALVIQAVNAFAGSLEYEVLVTAQLGEFSFQVLICEAHEDDRSRVVPGGRRPRGKITVHTPRGQGQPQWHGMDGAPCFYRIGNRVRRGRFAGCQ